MTDLLTGININTIVIAIGAIAIVVNNYRTSKLQGYKDALADKDLTISRLEGQIAANKAEGESELAKVKAKADSDIAGLKIEVDHLKQANLILQNTVTGRETLVEIQKTLNQFLPYVGAFDEFKRHDDLIAKKLDLLLAREQASKK